MTDLVDLLLGEPEDELGRVLHELRWMTLKHPLSARSAVRALIAEGRRFAATEEGHRWKHRLAGSELVRRGQLIWDVGTWGSLESDEKRLLPSEIVDAFARASARRDLETAVARRTELDEEIP